MKLWIKSTIGLSVVGFTAGVAIGGIAIFNATNKDVNGNPFSTNKSTSNQYPAGFSGKLSDLKISDLNAYFVKSSSEVSSVFATFDPTNDKEAVTYNGKKVSFDLFNTAFIKKYNSSPVQVVTFGPAIFKNEYLDAVSPKEFCEYVVWFLKNVSWGSDLAALEDFSIMRGVQTMGNGIVLGEHVNTNNEKTTIQFYPDGFFGSLPAYSQEAGQGQQVDNLLAKLSDLNNTLLTKDDIQKLVDNKRKIQNESNASDFRIRSIVPVQVLDEPNDPERNGKMGYEVYIDIYPGLIDDVLAIYPYLGKQLDGLHIERSSEIKQDANGEIYREDKLVSGKYWGIDPNSRIPFLAVLKASNPDFKGVGINWLKYVGQHEYGHHTTLQSLQDGSEKGVYAGGVSEQKALSASKFYSLDVINKYLDARAHNIKATASTIDSTSGLPQFIKFVENGVQEDEADIYGSWYQGNLAEAIDDPWRRASRVSLQELNKVAVARGVSLSDLMLENAWDISSATLNPGFKGNAYVYVKDATNGVKLQKISDAYNQATAANGSFLKDAKGRPIEFNEARNQFIIQYWANGDGTPSSEPVLYQFDTGNAGQVLNYSRPNTNNILDKTGTPITNWSSGSKRITVVKDANGNPVIPDGASLNEVYAEEQSISGFLANYAWDYSIGGWESTDTLASGFRIGAQAYQEDEATDVSADQSSAVKQFLTLARRGLFRWFIYRERNFDTKISKDNVDYFAPDLKGTVAEEWSQFGDYIFKPLQQGVAYGAFDSLGAFIKANNNYYSSLPTGTYGPWGVQATSRTDIAWSTLLGQFGNAPANTDIGMFKIVSEADPNQILYMVDDGTADHGQLMQMYDVVAKKEVGPTFRAVETATKAPKLKMYLVGAQIDTLGAKLAKIVDDRDDLKALMPNFKKLDKTMLSDDLKKFMLGGTEELTMQKYVEAMSVDPLNDFKFTSINGSTVIKLSALSRIFNINEIKNANPGMTDDEIELALTATLTLDNLIFLKDDMASIADLKDPSKNESIKALLLGGKDEKGASVAFISYNATLRKWFWKQPTASDDKTWSELIDALKQQKISWNTVDPTLKLDIENLSYNEIALLTGIWRWNPTTESSHYEKQDFGMVLTVGPTKDIQSQIQSRNNDKIEDIFSDYTFNLPEMTNRDYLQITYMPSFSDLENTPNWFEGSSEAETGEEYAIDSSATKMYLEGSMYGLQSKQNYTALQEAIQKVFHFKINSFGNVEAEIDPATGMQYPLASKGIIAASNLNNWKNYVQPSFIGKPVAKSNGFFKDDMIRRAVGNEIYDLNGDWNYTIVGDELYEANTTGKVLTKATPPTAVGKYYTGTTGTVVVDVDKNILIDFRDGLLKPTAFANAKYNWDSIDLINGQVKDGKGTTVAGFDSNSKTVNDLNNSTIGYIVTDVISTTDPTKIEWKVYNREIYEFVPGTDYTDETQIYSSTNLTGPKIVKHIRGNEIYDLNGKPIQDNSIRIKDIYKNDVTDRANAIWQFLLQEKGIGDGLDWKKDANGAPILDANGKRIITDSGRNIEGLWRSPNRDASYLWGYIPTEMEVNGVSVKAEDIKYVAFKDVNSGSMQFLPVSIGQNNLFYYADRGTIDANGNVGTKHTIEDDGFTSWTSDYAAMGGYRDGLLLADHQYVISLVDKDYKEIMPIKLGSRTVIAENGKSEGKAPNKIRELNGQAVISVQDQFNN